MDLCRTTLRVCTTTTLSITAADGEAQMVAEAPSRGEKRQQCKQGCTDDLQTDQMTSGSSMKKEEEAPENQRDKKISWSERYRILEMPDLPNLQVVEDHRRLMDIALPQKTRLLIMETV